jgi:hypothetical protein
MSEMPPPSEPQVEVEAEVEDFKEDLGPFSNDAGSILVSWTT